MAPRASALLALAYLAFVGLGLPDGVLGVAWPSIRAHFGLPLDALAPLLMTATAGYVVSSFASGRVLARIDLGTLLALSCFATAGSLLGYALAPSWAWMVALGALAGLGAGAIDAGLNHHVAARHSGRTLSLLHACYGLGTAAGPVLMTAVLMEGRPWQRGYVWIGAAQVALALAFAATRRLWRPASSAAAQPAADVSVPARATWRRPATRLGMAAFCLYVGLEASAGAWTYSLLREGRHFGMAASGAAVSVFWGGLMAGRIAYGLLPLRITLTALVRGCIATGAVAAALLATAPGLAATLAAVGLLGMACGPVFPALVAATPRRMAAPDVAHAIGFQVAAAALGQSLLPASFGVLAEAIGLRVLPLLLLGTVLALAAVHEALAARAPLVPSQPAEASNRASQGPRRAAPGEVR